MIFMKTTSDYLKELLLLLISLVPLIYLLVMGNKIPDEVPIHWNAAGEIDNYGSKFFPVYMNLGLYVLLTIVPLLDKRLREKTSFKELFFRLKLVMFLFFSMINCCIFYIASGNDLDMVQVIIIGILILFAMLGNYLINVRQNWFIGIRTPWTMQNEEVWKRTHRLGGKLWFYMSLGMLALTFIIDLKQLPILFFTALMVMVVVPIVYSYVIFKQQKKEEH
jgi:uncharacterized membrane protein